MKYFSYLFAFVLLSFATGCNQNEFDVSTASILEKSLPYDGMIIEAESKVGTLFKIRKEYYDPSSGSKFIMAFAAKDEKTLNNFFVENQIEILGITLAQKNELIKKANGNRISDQKNSNSSLENFEDEFEGNGVFYDLISKELKGNDIGLSFSIKPNYSYNVQNSKSKVKAINWRQQTSLPWCEEVKFQPIVETPAKNYVYFVQWRGIFWNGPGLPEPLITNGQPFYKMVDGPKFTRFGGEDPVIYKFSVTWYDWESGSSVNG